jgi:hypothetical protein
MQKLKIILLLIAAPLLILSTIAHIYIKFRLAKKYQPDLDDYYYELENQNPDLARYEKWTKITFSAITTAVLLLFVAIAL